MFRGFKDLPLRQREPEINFRPIVVDDAKAIIFSTEKNLTQEDVNRLRAQWDRAMEGLHDAPKVLIVSGMQVTVIGRDSE